MVTSQVIVDTSSGYKLGVVKYVGVTDFSPGEWIGISLDRPYGESS